MIFFFLIEIPGRDDLFSRGRLRERYPLSPVSNVQPNKRENSISRISIPSTCSTNWPPPDRPLPPHCARTKRSKNAFLIPASFPYCENIESRCGERFLPLCSDHWPPRRVLLWQRANCVSRSNVDFSSTFPGKAGEETDRERESKKKINYRSAILVLILWSFDVIRPIYGINRG